MKKPLVSLIQRPRPVSSSSLRCHAMRSSRAWRSKIYYRKGRLKDKALSDLPKVDEKDPFPRFYLFRSLVALNCCTRDKFWRQIVSDKFCPQNIRIARLIQCTCISANLPRKFQLLRVFSWDFFTHLFKVAWLHLRIFIRCWRQTFKNSVRTKHRFASDPSPGLISSGKHDADWTPYIILSDNALMIIIFVRLESWDNNSKLNFVKWGLVSNKLLSFYALEESYTAGIVS